MVKLKHRFYDPLKMIKLCVPQCVPMASCPWKLFSFLLYSAVVICLPH